jgi:phage baseplate assembly protein W
MAIIRGDAVHINLAPATLEEEVLRNAAMILVTPRRNVPLGRGIGLARDFVDRNPDAARTLMIGEIVGALNRYEPRAEVETVRFDAAGETGKYIPVLEVRIDGGE